MTPLHSSYTQCLSYFGMTPAAIFDLLLQLGMPSLHFAVSCHALAYNTAFRRALQFGKVAECWKVQSYAKKQESSQDVLDFSTLLIQLMQIEQIDSLIDGTKRWDMGWQCHWVASPRQTFIGLINLTAPFSDQSTPSAQRSYSRS